MIPLVLGWHDASKLLSIAHTAADAACELISEAYWTADRCHRHKGEVDLVTATDEAAEDTIRRILAPSGIPVLGEEQGMLLPNPEHDLVWVVDPLDGTTNFAHRVPHFAVSIGLWSHASAQRHVPAALLGVIANPISGERFSADTRFAWLGESRLPILDPPVLNQALVATGFPYDRRTNPDDNTRLWRRFMKNSQGVRRMGAAALDMAFVAAGRLDGFWEPRLKPWDLAAGIAIAERVGAVVTTYDGGPWSFEAPNVLVAAPPLHGAMQKLILKG